MTKPQSAVEVLDGAIRLIQRGWVRGRFFARDGGKICYCASGAIRRASGAAFPDDGGVSLRGGQENLAGQAHTLVRRELRARGSGDGVAWFNDHIAKEKKDVVDLLKAAKARAEAHDD